MANQQSHRQPNETTPSHVWTSRGFMPHFDGAGLVQHVTFHLADSLPSTAIETMQRAVAELPESKQAAERRRRIQELLDNGLGACVLRHEACARTVEDALLFGDGTRYRLLAWAIMPNHVHVLIEQRAGWSLARVVHGWKRHTARQIHLLGLMRLDCRNSSASASAGETTQGPLWQRDYWDRFIRDERHFLTAKVYIENNPVAAGLVSTAAAWPWGSARLGEAFGRDSIAKP